MQPSLVPPHRICHFPSLSADLSCDAPDAAEMMHRVDELSPRVPYELCGVDAMRWCCASALDEGHVGPPTAQGPQDFNVICIDSA
jgi:hypothetical protein